MSRDGSGRGAYDVDAVRALYPALADGWAYLDGAAGTQVPRSVIGAESAAYAAGIGNHGGHFAASHRSDAHTAAARAAVADLVGAGSPSWVVLGPSMTALTYRFATGQYIEPSITYAVNRDVSDVVLGLSLVQRF